LSAIETETIEAATFVIVFPTSIVTRSLLGKAIRLLAYLKISFEDLKSTFKSFCLIEKKATSEPEKKAEEITKMNNKSIWNIQSISKNIQSLSYE
jgi:hypothetical protein